VRRGLGAACWHRVTLLNPQQHACGPLQPRLTPKVAPLSFVFIAYVIVSLVSLGRVNVPMFTALRRLTIVFVMVEEFFFLGVTPSRKVVLTVLLMIVGAAIAAWKDLTYDPVSYGYLFLTNLFTSLYTVFINKVRADTGLNLFAMMYYNNITTMPALLVSRGRFYLVCVNSKRLNFHLRPHSAPS
jgi:drug/metabolite transporter (DMT)-like permease